MGTGVFARAASTYNGGRLTEADEAVFFSDDPNYIVRLNGNGEAELVRAYTVSFDTVGIGTAPDSQKVIPGEKVTRPSYIPPKEYVLTGWYKESTYTTPWNFDIDTVTGNITLYAKLEEAVAAIGETGYLTVQDAVDAAQAGETVTMLKSVIISPELDISRGKSLTLDLNGCTIWGMGFTNTITVQGTLTLIDTKGGGAVTGGARRYSVGPWDDGGGIIVEANGTFILESGTISGNKALQYGSGVNVHPGGHFIMNGGSITGNNSLSVTITMSSGGGVYVYEYASFTMNGSEISNNTAGSGGGVYVSENGKLTINGGTIEDNYADGNGGGVYYADSEFSVSGGIVSGNTDDNGGDNVYLASGRMLSIPQKPAEDTLIGITMGYGSGIFAAGSGHTISKAEKAYFFSDDPQYGVGLNPASQLFLGRFHTVKFDANTTDEVTGTMEPQTFIEGEKQEITPHTFKRRDWGFDGWNTAANGSGTSYDDGEEITVTEDLTLYAQWVPAHTVTFIPNDMEGSIRAEGTMHAEQFNTGTTQNLTANVFTRRGYEFKGWNTAADGTGTAYADQASVTITEDLTLYAQWKLITYTISYDLKGSSLPEGSSNPETYTVETDDFTLVNPVRTGYSFGSWWDGTSIMQTVTIPAGSTGDRSYEVFLWEANQYTVRYEPNGAPAGYLTDYFIYDGEKSLFGMNPTGTDGDPFRYTGYRFTEWSTAADGSGTRYTLHQTVKKPDRRA